MRRRARIQSFCCRSGRFSLDCTVTQAVRVRRLARPSPVVRRSFELVGHAQKVNPMRINATTRIYDVTLPFSPELPVWPGDPPIEFTPVNRTAAGSTFNSSRIACPTHCGTHVDPPWHAAHDGATLSDIPIERWVGPCQVVRIEDSVDRIEPEHLDAAGIGSETVRSRLLLRTRNSAHWGFRPLTFATD